MEGQSQPPTGESNPGELFISGIPENTTQAEFMSYFSRYGDITKSYIVSKNVGISRGYGYLTYADPSVADKVIKEDNHMIKSEQVTVRRAIPWRTKKIFVGGLHEAMTEVEFRDLFRKHGNVIESEIIRDHVTGCSRRYGFITFDSEQTVERLIANHGYTLRYKKSKLGIRKYEPWRSKQNRPPPSSHASAATVGSNQSGGASGDDGRGYGGAYGGYEGRYSGVVAVAAYAAYPGVCVGHDGPYSRGYLLVPCGVTLMPTESAITYSSGGGYGSFYGSAYGGHGDSSAAVPPTESDREDIDEDFSS